MAADEDEFDAEFGSMSEGDEFDAEFADVSGEPAPATSAPASPAPKQSDPSGLDYLLSLADGMSFGHGKSFENLLGPGPAKLRHPDAQITNPGMMANVPQTPGTKLAKAAGTALESIPLAIAAGPGIGAQALLGAATGGASAHGSGEDVVGGALLGGALGAAGGMVGKGLSALKAPAAAGGQMTLPMKGAAAPSALDDAMRKLTEAKPDLYSAITSPWAAAKNAAGRATLTAAQKTSPEALRAAGQAGASVGGSWFGDETGRVVGAAAAQAQDTPWNVETGDAELYQDGVRAVVGEPIFRTVLSDSEEARFQKDMRTGRGYKQWRNQFERLYGGPPNLEDPDYDYRGAWQAGIRPEPYKHDKGRYHWASSRPDGSMLKGENHPTAWMEHFMRATGKDPHEVGVRSKEEGDAYIARSQPWQVQTGEAQIRDTSPAATQSWAVESVLYQGNTGLPREAEQQLTEAALSGDPEKLATATFLLSGKYPQFSDALQKQRASLVREED